MLLLYCSLTLFSLCCFVMNCSTYHYTSAPVAALVTMFSPPFPLLPFYMLRVCVRVCVCCPFTCCFSCQLILFLMPLQRAAQAFQCLRLQQIRQRHQTKASTIQFVSILTALFELPLRAAAANNVEASTESIDKSICTHSHSCVRAAVACGCKKERGS